MAIHEATRIDKYVSNFRVVVDGAVTAEVAVVNLSGADGLDDFLRRLAEDFTGWEGTRTWNSLEDQLSLEADWRSLGHVQLRFTLRPTYRDVWSLTATFELEAGEQLRALAADLGHILAA